MFKCDNCSARYKREDQLKHVFPDIPDLLQRLDPGGTVPAGECPACGALVYPESSTIRLLVLLDGGLVQNVLADKPGVEVAVLNQDIEGMFDDDIVEIVGEKDVLHGTLQDHDVTIAPVLIESAYRPVEQAAP